MTNVHIDDAFSFGRIGPPDQWREVPHTLRASFPPVKCSTYDRADINALHTIIKQIRYAAYVRDAGKDVWEPNIKGDCEDKCLYLIQQYVGTEMYNSMRLAICVLPNGQQHAVILLYIDANTFVIDPTLSIMAVPWEKYPVQKWLIRHSHGFLWENFKEKTNEY